MSLPIQSLFRIAESGAIPDPVLRLGADAFVAATQWRLTRPGSLDPAILAGEMESEPIAKEVHLANEQHYELPASFFELILGARRKYSCGYFDTPDASLDEAETAALTRSVRYADIADGQDILELGCGWGSLTLFMAETFPRARITAVSNAPRQRRYIEAEAARRGLTNVVVVTADIGAFTPTADFDRIVSVEMVEHVSNWPALFRRMHNWVRRGGKIYLHFFSHRRTPYRFDHEDPIDWVARYFFAGGVMPSDDLVGHLAIPFEIEGRERWSGTHYARTARAWLRRFDERREAVEAVLRPVYGADLAVWLNRWRLFFISTERLFGFQNGDPWGISHYRLTPTQGLAAPSARPIDRGACGPFSRAAERSVLATAPRKVG